MITRPRLRTVRRGAVAMQLALILLASAALLASCAAPPKSEPSAAQPAQPSTPESSRADQSQPTAAAPAKPEAPAPQEAAPSAAQPKVAPPDEAEPASPPAPAAAQPAPGTGEADEPNPIQWTLGARAPRHEGQASKQVEPANAEPSQKPQPEPAALPVRVKPRDNAGAQVRPVAAGSQEERPRGNLEKEPAQAKPPAQAADTKKDAGCGAKGSSKEPDPQPSPEGPQPRWVCKELQITAEPVWSGGTVDFAFEIANEGEGDLKIKLKKP